MKESTLKVDTQANKVRQTLLVGDHGRIVSFKKIRIWLMTLISIVVLCLLVIIGMSYNFYLNRNELSNLKTQISALEKSTSALKKERDLHMADLVIAKAKLSPASARSADNSSAGVSGTMAQGPSAGKKDGNNGQKIKAGGTSRPAPVAKKPAVVVKKSDAAAPESPVVEEKVDVQKFSITHDSTGNRVRINYIVRNMSTGGHVLSGRTMLVLSDPSTRKDKWLSMPGVPLVDGKPARKLGAIFRIKNFKTMSFASPRLTPPYMFSDCTVYVFSSKGRLLSERSYPVSIDVQPVKPAALPDTKVEQLKGKEPESKTISPPDAGPTDAPQPPVAPESTGEEPQTPTAPIGPDMTTEPKPEPGQTSETAVPGVDEVTETTGAGNPEVPTENL
ncbi:MAG: hypothetical protein HKM93_11160 [Desulfobacteraceae bacterium]|nr:hypothetical protein [Desulfobacteraceae bacterium]